MIIGLAGQKRSGKNTAARAFPDYTPVAFADALRTIVAEGLGIEVTEENKEQAGNWIPKANYDIRFLGCFYDLCVAYETLTGIKVQFTTNQKIAAWEHIQTLCHESDDGTLTPRRVLQVVGTDIFRAWRPAAWTDALAAKVDSGGDYVITDVRFQDEVEFVQERGGIVIRIDRPATDKPSVEHASEDVRDLKVDAVVINNTAEDVLLWKVRHVVEQWRHDHYRVMHI